MTRISRRSFAAGLGAGLLAATFGAHRVGRADGSTFAKRLIVFFTPNGTIHDLWRPTGSGANFSFPAGSILEPLAPHQSKIIVCDGIDFHGVENHEAGMANMLTGGGDASTTSGGRSIDQFIAAQLGQNDRFSSLELGVQTSAWGGNVQTRMCYSGPGAYVPPDDDPGSVYQRIFGDVGQGTDAAAKALARRKKILALNTGELESLKGGLGKAERQKLDDHLAALKKVEAGLAGPGTCAAPASPSVGSLADNASIPAIGKAQMDLLVLALACGMTRVGSLQWAHTVAPHVLSWLGISEGHHSLSHSDDGNTAGVDAFRKAERWFAGQFAYLLDQLATTPAPEGGMLLDSTLVVWCKELGDARLHDCKSVPFVLAGGGYFPTGRYLNFKGAPHQKLLVSICRAMGLDNQTYGDPSKGTGTLDGLG